MNHAEVLLETEGYRGRATTGRLLQYIKRTLTAGRFETLIMTKLTGCSTWASLRTLNISLVRPAQRKQTMLFSATLEGDAIKDFAERLLEDPVGFRQSVSPRA